MNWVFPDITVFSHALLHFSSFHHYAEKAIPLIMFAQWWEGIHFSVIFLISTI